MALWEYKTISSGKGGFATPALLENFLNQLGKDEWEIVEFTTHPDNALAFHGLARRPTMRDWTLEAAIAAAAKAEADKLRAELMSRQHAGEVHGASDSGSNGKPNAEASLEPSEKNGLRELRDTERDHDPEALAEEAADLSNEWDKLGESEDDLPTFFDAIKPHLRKNQRGAGMSVAIDYLAKRWDQIEADLVGALQECGFVLPENEDDVPVYLEFEGDLYWLNRNGRGQLFLNTREKPRPRFKTTQGARLDPEDPALAVLNEEHAAEVAERARRAEEHAAREAEAAARRAEREAAKEAAREAAEKTRLEQQASQQAAQDAAQQAVASGLPAGEALLKILHPFLRRNRRGPGSSGSTYFLAKTLQQPEPMLIAAFAEMGLTPPEKPGEKPVYTDIGGFSYWLNKDARGGFWINTREKRERPSAEASPESTESGAESSPEPAALPSADDNSEAAGQASVPAEAITACDPADATPPAIASSSDLPAPEETATLPKEESAPVAELPPSDAALIITPETGSAVSEIVIPSSVESPVQAGPAADAVGAPEVTNESVPALELPLAPAASDGAPEAESTSETEEDDDVDATSETSNAEGESGEKTSTPRPKNRSRSRSRSRHSSKKK